MAKNALSLNFLTSSKFDNPDRPFTELLSLLNSMTVNGNDKSNHDPDTLAAIYQHSKNSLAALIWGLESFGYLLATAGLIEEIQHDHISGAGHFIKSIANLIEALTHVGSQIELELK